MGFDYVVKATDHFFPVVLAKVNPSGPSTVVEHLGTGFFLYPGVLITCWHCVADQLPPDHRYAIRVEEGKGVFKAAFLGEVERDQNRTDMATARCSHTLKDGLTLSKSELLYGEDVFSFGFPFPERRLEFDGRINHVISGRYLKGYLSRHFFYDHPRLGKTEAYELDMRAPEGMSGAALLRRDTLEVVGLIFGSNDLEIIEESARIDPDSGTRESEIRRITSFALAYDLQSLSRLTTGATNGIPLAEHLSQLTNAKGPGTMA